jgi:hypothetical protein
MRFEQTTFTMGIVKGIPLLMGLSMIAGLVACGGSGSSSHTTPPPPTITVSLSSTPASLYLSDIVPVSATVTNDSSNAGVTWSCTPASSCGTFSASSSASGTAVYYMAPGTATSNVVITATSKASSSATKSSAAINVSGFGLAAGQYVFSVSGTDSAAGPNGSTTSPYAIVGAFSWDGSSTIAGEQDYSDYNHNVAPTPGNAPPAAATIASGTVATNADGTLSITLVYGAAVFSGGPTQITLNVSMVSATKGLLIENDSWASGKGELDLQAAAPLPALANGYAFFGNGLDVHGLPMSIGGVIKVDGSGTISGAGSVFDINDGCGSPAGTACVPGAVLSDQSIGPSTVTGPDSLGLVSFNLSSSCSLCGGTLTPIILHGYMIDAAHIMIVENWLNDNLSGSPISGMAIGQGSATGSFSTLGAAATMAFRASGSDSNGILQTAGALTLNPDNSVTGILSFNDTTNQTTQGGVALAAESTSTPCSGGSNTTTACYTVDPTGRVTLTNITDGATFTYNLQMYLTGEGHAFVISMDSTASATPDELGGTAGQQSGTLSASSLSGSYALTVDQFVAGIEQDGAGEFYSDGASNLTGFYNLNAIFTNPSGCTAPCLASDQTFKNTFAAGSANGVVKVTAAGSSGNTFTAYLIDNTQGYVIEDDNTELTLGDFIQH